MMYKLLLGALLLAGLQAAVSENRPTDPTQPSVIYRSGDLGLSWQPVDNSLPSDVRVHQLETQGKGLIAVTENHGLYRSNKDAATWQPMTPLVFTPNQKIRYLQVADNALYTNLYEHGFYVSADGGNIWMPLPNNLPDKIVRGVWQQGTVMLAGTDSGIFRTVNQGKSWEKVFDDGQVVSFTEQNGVLIAGTYRGAIRSRDQGKTWEWVLQEGNVYRNMAIEDAIVVCSGFGEMRLSRDAGKTWMRIDEDLPAQEDVYDVVKVQNALICSRESGLYRSFDWGKSWELVLETPDIKARFLDLTVVDGVVYSCVGFGGC